MTLSEYVRHEVDNVGFQLEKCLEGVREEDLGQKVCDQAMTLPDMVEHLCEVYQAVVTEAGGGKHEWGSFSIQDKSWTNLLSTFGTMRTAACDAVVSDDEEKAKHAHDFIVAHDAYHVGQIALLRLKTNPDWNPYSIYR